MLFYYSHPFMNWTLKKFEDLTPFELYAIMQLRSEVFVVEQNCAYLDADNKDLLSYHFMGWEENTLIAYTRLLPPGLAYPQPSIGRVVTSPSARKSGYGRELMEKSIETIYGLFGKTAIKIGAQLYLKKFYSSLGFEATGDVYLEDNIEHIEMILP